MYAIIQEVDLFSANYGGTDIVSPLSAVQQWPDSPAQKKRVFILTDGCVRNPTEVINAAQAHSEHIRVFTFGLGSGCDSHLVKRTAQ